MDLVHLVYLVVAREQRKQRDDFEEHAANSPQVHLIPVVAISEQTLRRTIPPCGDVLSVWLFRVDASARSKVGQLHMVLAQQNILRLDVPMEDAVPVHVVNGLDELVHVVFDSVFW